MPWDAAEQHLETIKSFEGLAGLAGRDPRDVAGLDPLSDLIRSLQDWHIPTPAPGAQR